MVVRASEVASDVHQATCLSGPGRLQDRRAGQLSAPQTLQVMRLYQIVNEGVCSYEEFAREAAKIVGASEAAIDVVTEAEMKRPAPRPACTPMECVPRMRPWQDALREFATLSTCARG